MMARVLTAVVAIAASQGAAQSAALRPGPVVRIDLREDLDTMLAAEQLESLLNEAASLRASLVVLELKGNEARLDVVHRMAGAIRSNPLPVAAWIHGGDDARVGIGQLTLSLFADRCVVDDRVEVTGAARGEIDSLAPEKTSWDTIAIELADWSSPRLGRRSVTSELDRVLTASFDGLWLVKDGTNPGLRVGPDAPSGGVSLMVSRDGAKVVRMTGADLRGAGLADGSARDWRGVAKSLGLGGERVEERAVWAALRIARARGEGILGDCEKALNRVESLLDLADPKTHSVAPAKYRDAASAARQKLDPVKQVLDTLDEVYIETPELLRTPAPGQGKAEKPSAYAAKWRSLLRSRRDRWEKLDAKARLFAEQ